MDLGLTLFSVHAPPASSAILLLTAGMPNSGTAVSLGPGLKLVRAVHKPVKL
jgi:hypothetical protein